MNGRLLDANNDVFTRPTGLYDGDGNPLYRIVRAESRREKILRNVNCVLRTFQGEAFADYDAGVPWYDDILASSVLYVDEISQEIKDKILEVDGVSDVLDIQIEVNGRNIGGTYKIRLDDGTFEDGRI